MYSLLLLSCVEEFVPENTPIENQLLVVDALVTDEVKKQQVRLWKTANIGPKEEPVPETGAQVVIVENDSNTFVLNEIAPGVYESVRAWGVQSRQTYRLQITRSNGRSYLSDNVTAPPPSNIERVQAVAGKDDQGEPGMAILVSSNDPSQNSKFYRYEYTEAYKIIAPEWSAFEFDVINREYPTYEVGFKLNENNRETCYGSGRSTNILQFSTSALAEDRVVDYPLRFIPQSSYTIGHRYTIEVSQYVQTPDAYTFSEQLKEQEGGQSLLSTVQPGFLQGNVRSETDKNERVVGYFDVRTLERQRIWVNYAELFPGEALPPYAVNCQVVLSPPLYSLGAHQMGVQTSPLIEAIDAHTITYVAENTEFSDIHESPFYVVKAECGDCRLLGSEIKPDFWVD
jgi:hypothetical protein